MIRRTYAPNIAAVLRTHAIQKTHHPHARPLNAAATLLLLPLLSALCSLAATTSALADPKASPSSEARVLYRASELAIFAETFRGDFLKLWEGPSAGVSSVRAEIVERQIERHFGADTLEAMLLDYFATSESTTESKAVLAWSAEPVGQSLTARPRSTRDTDLLGVLEAYAETNTTPIDKARVKILAEIARESLLDQIYISSSSVATFLVSLSLALADDPAGGVPDGAWEKLLPGLFAKAAQARERYTRAAAGVLQVEHTHASTSELGAYLAFRQSTDGRWLSKESATALLSVLRTQQEAYGEDLKRIFSKIQ